MSSQPIPNEPVAAAVLAAGAGCAFVGIFALAADYSKMIAKLLTFYSPAGSLSGVSTIAMACWLGTWILLSRLWRNENVAFARVNAISLALLALGIALTFPPLADLLQGK